MLEADDDYIGRFRIVRRIGAGGMGQVYAAEDPELERLVALKVIRGELSALADQARFQREAKAMARLRHPNVVTIHEVGEHEGELFIAMELLEGQTLQAWLERPRDWRATRDVFVGAGRGLAAAHAAGIVHRDFKPANVSVGPSGVRVLDFGVALAAGDGADAGGGSPSLEGVALTLTGTVIGTPAYLAPEQLRGDRATPRSDQWSFCVSLYQALYRRLPFTEPSGDGREAEMARGARFPPGPPRFLIALLRRGLQVDAERRYPSMLALLADLERDPRRRALLAGGVAAVAAAVAAVAIAWPRAAAPCTGAQAALAGVWGARERARVGAAFAASGKPYAAETFARVAARFDDYAASWVAGHTEACEATEVRHAQSAELLDRRMACLDRLRGALASVVTAASADLGAAELQKVDSAAAGLGDVAACERPAAAPRPVDAAMRRRVDDLYRRLDEEAARGALRDPVGAAAAVVALVGQADGIPYPPLQAHALLTYGQLLALANQARLAAPQLERAIRVAGDTGDDWLEARAWIALLRALAAENRGDEVLHLELPAGNAVRRIGAPHRLAGELELALAIGERARSRIAEARRHADLALALFDGPADGLVRVRAWQTLAALAFDQEDAPAMLAASRRALDEAQRTLGRDHAQVAGARSKVGIALLMQNELDEAERELLDAAAAYRRIFGTDSEDAASCLTYVSLARLRSGARKDEALAAAREAVAMLEAKPPGELFAGALQQLGQVLSAMHRYPEALTALERALTVRRRVLGEDHPTVAVGLAGLGGMYISADRPAEAVPVLRRALEISEKNGVIGPRLAYALVNLGEAEDLAKQPAAALPHLERALGLLGNGEESLRARAQVDYGHALWQQGERRRGMAQAEAALELCRTGRVAKIICADMPKFVKERFR